MDAFDLGLDGPRKMVAFPGAAHRPGAQRTNYVQERQVRIADNPDFDGPVAPHEACPHPPGSPGKVAWLGARYNAGISLWRPDDVPHERIATHHPVTVYAEIEIDDEDEEIP